VDESTLLTEFVHLLLTGAFHSGDLLGSPSVRVQLAPPMEEPWSVSQAVQDGWVAASLEGGVRGVLAVAVRGEGVPTEAGAPGDAARGARSVEDRLLTDLSARIGRLLGLPITMTPLQDGKAAYGRAAEEASASAPWMRFTGHVQLEGVPEGVQVGVLLSPSLKDGIYRLLAGDVAEGEGTSFEGGTAPAVFPGGNGHDAGVLGAPAAYGYGEPVPGLGASAGQGALRAVHWRRFTAEESELDEQAVPVDMDFIGDLPLTLTVELGRARVSIEDIMGWGPGSILELDRLAGEMLDVLVNGRPIAKGEIVVVEDVFNVKITDIVSPQERIRRGAVPSDDE